MVTSLKIALTMFVARVNTNLQKISQNGVELLYDLEALYKLVTVGCIDPSDLLSFFVAFLRFVITNINKNQKISAFYVKYVLFILDKKKAKRVN